MGLIHPSSGTVQQRSNHVKYYLGRYRFPRTAKRCQAGLLLGKANHLRKCLTAGVAVSLSSQTIFFILVTATMLSVEFQSYEASLQNGYRNGKQDA